MLASLSLPLSRSSDVTSCDRSLVDGEVALNLVDLGSEPVLAPCLFVELMGEAIELARSGICRLGSLLPEATTVLGCPTLGIGRHLELLLGHLLLYGAQMRILVHHLVVLELTWREDALTDILSVVSYSLIQVFLVDDCVLGNHVAVVVLEERVEHVVLLCLLSDHLATTEGVERIVLRSIPAQELRVGESVGRLRTSVAKADLARVDRVTGRSLIPHRVRVTQIDSSAITDVAFHAFETLLSLVEARIGGHLDHWLHRHRVTSQSQA